jgi:hypothetical protein
LQADDRMENDLLTNKTNAALLRDSEQQIVRAKIRPINLRKVPVEKWDRYLEHDVTLPRKLQNWLDEDAAFEFPLSKKQIHEIEEDIEKYHGVRPPFYIYMSLTLQQTGQPWVYVKKAGQYLTGLTLSKKTELDGQ